MLKAREAVLRMEEYRPPLGQRRGLRLDFNENTTCSLRVLAKLGELDGDCVSRYPEREAIEQQVAEFLHLEAAQVLLTNGVDEGIHLLCETYLEPGDEALIVTPTFGMYQLYAQQTGAQVTRVQSGADFSFPLDELLAAVNNRTRLMAIANPNNPTGAVAGRGALLRVLQASADCAVLVDEAYYEFYGQSVLDELKRFPNLFVARTFSKAYGLAGFRIGVLAGDAGQMRLVRKVVSPYNVNGVALACLAEAVADQEFVRDYVRQVRHGRERLQRKLAELGVTYWPSQANFVLTRVGEKHAEFVAAMRRRGILVRDRNHDPGCAGCVRITVGTEEQTDVLLAALEAALAEIQCAAQAMPTASQEGS